MTLRVVGAGLGRTGNEEHNEAVRRTVPSDRLLEWRPGETDRRLGR